MKPTIQTTRHLLSPLLLILACACFAACDPSVPAGHISVRNDSRDREYNVVQVSGGGKGCTLDPGESCLMPKGTRSIMLSRRYAEYTRTYSVECPRIEGSGITIKLIDAHLNKMAGGCKTVASSGG